MRRKIVVWTSSVLVFFGSVLAILEWGFKVPIFYKPKVYDCFMFFNEMDLLEVHLAELYDHVDKFVIVESIERLSGKEKPLYFQENKQRYVKYLDKIIHVVVKDRPYLGLDNPWPREFFQRNQIMRGLKKCHPSDIVIIGDLDEIVRGSQITRMVKKLKKGKDPIVVPILDWYRWFYNRKEQEPITGTILTTYKYLKKKGIQKAREQRFGHQTIANGGWHFSNMGGWGVFLEKIHSFSHWREVLENKDSTDAHKQYEWIQKNLALVSIDETFPQCIRDHIEEFEKNGYLDKKGGFFK